jgi:hypothetical protein
MHQEKKQNVDCAHAKRVLSSGWILVTGLFLLCLLGTGLTWWNYSQQVFSSADGLIVNQAGTTECTVVFHRHAAKIIQPGHSAIITVGEDQHPLTGRVVSQSLVPNGTLVLMRLVNPPSELPNNARCSVTIDTTVPPQ